MAGPARDPDTGEFMQPGLCPVNPYTGKRECPPATEKDCLVVEKVFDQCFLEDTITRWIPIPYEPGPNNLGSVARVECEVLSAECEVVDVGPPLPETNNIRVVTLKQEVEIQIKLWDNNPAATEPLYTFTEKINDAYAQVQLYVPPAGVLFGPGGGPFVFCEIVNFLCSCNTETVAPGQPISNLICTIKICKVIEVTAFVKLLVPVYGYCVPRPCEQPPEPELECPPVADLFPPQMDEENLNDC